MRALYLLVIAILFYIETLTVYPKKKQRSRVLLALEELSQLPELSLTFGSSAGQSAHAQLANVPDPNQS